MALSCVASCLNYIYGDKYLEVTFRTKFEGICLVNYLLRVTFLYFSSYII